MKEGIPLPFDGPDRGWLPDGSRMTWLNAPSGKKEDRLPVRAAEHNAVLPRGDGTEEVSETCTVITTLLDHQAAPAGEVRDTYLTRWSASETTFGEDKTTITGAGNRTSGPVPLEELRDLVLGQAWREHRERGCPGAVTTGTRRPLRAGSLDGTLLRVPDRACEQGVLRHRGHRR